MLVHRSHVGSEDEEAKTERLGTESISKLILLNTRYTVSGAEAVCSGYIAQSTDHH